ncbi:winged helix-turn-helix transcriptional regulator [Cohnella thailandensis]|uniref:Helix-turn-helix transcriptional regulator n=1 Tax=Cohnella thailandensis TaxID=557557 RepID=A0A841SUA3_9BACL|nr:helix-turn-helix domain-containing protein [Cohnella thailandensis]MBB6634176.1 helix-turn-helix transcriptional regulator [Cohnella thailandensis]MBP1972326.1 DNA-binding HxlR family transcriptional regulator [Cohnella thailandensis]
MTEQRENNVPKKYKVGVEAALEVMGGKWKPLIIYHLMAGPKRTSELRRLMPDISHKMLTAQLRGLEKDEIVARKVYNEIPPKMEYTLTSYGWGLKPALDHLCYWGEDHLEKVYGDKSKVLEKF